MSQRCDFVQLFCGFRPVCVPFFCTTCGLVQPCSLAAVPTCAPALPESTNARVGSQDRIERTDLLQWSRRCRRARLCNVCDTWSLRALVATKRNPHRFEFLGFRVHGPSSKGGCRSRSRPVRHVQAISLMDTRIMGEELLWASSLGCDAWRWRQRGSILRWGMANRSFACLPQHNITDGMK